jgi:hypothetical protein
VDGTAGVGVGAAATAAVTHEEHATPKQLTQYFIAVPMKWRLVTLLGLLRRQMASKYVAPCAMAFCAACRAPSPPTV